MFKAQSIKEFYQALKPKEGLLRIVVPDIEKACKAYVNEDFKFFRKSSLSVYDEDAPIGGHLMSWFYPASSTGNGHVHCFDYEYLSYWLKRIGFRKIEKSHYRQSKCKELRLDGFDLIRHRNESLYVEAAK